LVHRPEFLVREGVRHPRVVAEENSAAFSAQSITVSGLCVQAAKVHGRIFTPCVKVSTPAGVDIAS